MIGFALVLIGVGLVGMLTAASRRVAVGFPALIAEVLGIALLVWTALAATGAARAERLERLNVEAAADSTHHFLRGQLQIATRLAVQAQLAHHAVATVTIQVPGATVTGVDTIHVSDTLRARLDTNGVHVGAVVALLPPPPTWTWSLVQDPLAYQVTFEGCHDHAARVTVAGPRWQAVQLVDLRQDPLICNPKPSWGLFSLKPPSLVWVVTIAVATYLMVR